MSGRSGAPISTAPASARGSSTSTTFVGVAVDDAHIYWTEGDKDDAISNT